MSGDLIHGINPAQEALRGDFRRPLEIFLARGDRGPRLRQLAQEAEAAGIPVRWRDRSELDRLAGHGHHQGALLRVEPFAYASLDLLLERWRSSGSPALFLALDGITDPHNLGALIRSADGAGCQGVLIPRDRACPVTSTVDRAAAGSLAHIPLCQVVNLSRALEELKEAGAWVFGLAGEAGCGSLYETDLTGDAVLVVGSEGGGLRPNVRRHCDGLLSIPLQGGVTSLNASVAGALALFEAVRQRRFAADKR